MQDNRGKEAATHGVFQHGVLQAFGHEAHVVRLIFHAHNPERQPAKARLQHREAQVFIALEEPGTKEGTHGSHGTPGMRSAAAQEGVAPEVTVTRVPLREAVVDKAQPGLVYRLPDRLQVGVSSG